jgi:hypothetical protein
METNDLFWKEKLAIKFCDQYRYKGKMREAALNAFCVGLSFGLKEKQLDDDQQTDYKTSLKNDF